MKLNKQQIEVIVSKIYNNKKEQVDKLVESTKQKEIDKYYGIYKSKIRPSIVNELKKSTSKYIRKDSSFRLNIDEVSKEIGLDLNIGYYSHFENIGDIDKSFISNISSKVVSQLTSDNFKVTRQDIYNLVVLSTIDAKDLEDLIKKVESKL